MGRKINCLILAYKIFTFINFIYSMGSLEDEFSHRHTKFKLPAFEEGLTAPWS
jgi:hypothetical protein